MSLKSLYRPGPRQLLAPSRRRHARVGAAVCVVALLPASEAGDVRQVAPGRLCEIRRCGRGAPPSFESGNSNFGWPSSHPGPSGQKPARKRGHGALRVCRLRQRGPCLQKPRAYHGHSFTLSSRPQVQKYAVLVRALAKVREEPALRHAVPIELVPGTTRCVALLAQPAQPVLADHLATPWVEAHARWRRRGRCIARDAKELVQIKVDAGDSIPGGGRRSPLFYLDLTSARYSTTSCAPAASAARASLARDGRGSAARRRPTLRATQQHLTRRGLASLGESAHFSQTEVSGTATSKSCRLAHPNGRDFYDLRGVGDQVFEASAHERAIRPRAVERARRYAFV